MRSFIGRATAVITASLGYMPVIAGIITPMLWILPAWYVTWYGLGYVIPFSETWSCLWVPSHDPITGMQDYLFTAFIWLISLGTFVSGFVIFLYGLGTLASARMNSVGLATNGPYAWIRHPQHLGIILMLILPALLRNILFGGLGSELSIRPGDLISVLLVTFLLLVVADLEELGLRKKYGQDYLDYCSRTPFIIPVRSGLASRLGKCLPEQG
ncbi:MAG: hypothetical protein QXQ81_10190, partial [Candidatus Thorarchaeota archaeon]